nr:hypothetical protein [uncultured Neokomagataea sp.]
MALDQFLKSIGLDRYDRNARIYPAFLCVLPIFVTILVWFPAAWTILGGLFSIIITSGIIFLLGQIVRYRGRLIEIKLGPRVGRAKTAALLCHKNNEIPKNTKQRYHTFLRKKGVVIPTVEEEHADPQVAFDAFRSAVDWLLTHTRPNAKTSGLLNENISYGFRRNTLGIKPVAIIVLLLIIPANAWMIFRSLDQNRIIAALVVEMMLIGALIAWVFIINSAFVEDASVAYAQRFLEQCEPKTITRNTKKTVEKVKSAT